MRRFLKTSCQQTLTFQDRTLKWQDSWAGWQSGYAAACKAVDAGSIPTPASKFVLQLIFLAAFRQLQDCPGGEIGRHKGLKIPRLSNGHAGSIPAPGTIL